MMNNWPEFKDNPQSVLVAVDGSGKRTYHVSLDEQQYNQARDAIAAMQWRPIETAPKDASWFMVCISYPDEEIRYVGGKPLIVFYDGVNLITHGGMQLASKGYYAPTHWMPLPPQPTGDL